MNTIPGNKIPTIHCICFSKRLDHPSEWNVNLPRATETRKSFCTYWLTLFTGPDGDCSPSKQGASAQAVWETRFDNSSQQPSWSKLSIICWGGWRAAICTRKWDSKEWQLKARQRFWKPQNCNPARWPHGWNLMSLMYGICIHSPDLSLTLLWHTGSTWNMVQVMFIKLTSWSRNDTGYGE